MWVSCHQKRHITSLSLCCGHKTVDQRAKWGSKLFEGRAEELCRVVVERRPGGGRAECWTSSQTSSGERLLRVGIAGAEVELPISGLSAASNQFADLNKYMISGDKSIQLV